MKKFLTISVLCSIMITCLFFTRIYSQSETDKLFKEARSLSKDALSVAANIFSEKEYEKALEYLTDAENQLKSGEKQAEIQQNLNSAITFFNHSIDASKTMNISFGDILKIRQLAVNADGDNAAPQLWKEGEDNFRDAVGDYNDKDMEGYQKSIKLAETNYKAAELAGIKAKYLSDLKASIAHAEEGELSKYAPVTFQKSKKYAQDIETLLDANRYDTLKAQATMIKGKYELAHGAYLEDMLRKLKEKESTDEDLILMMEVPLTKIVVAHNIEPLFDKGYDGISTQLATNITNDLATIDKITKENEALDRDLKDYKAKFAEADALSKQLNVENGTLRTSLDDAKSKLAQLQTENVTYKAHSDVLEKNQKLIDSVSTFFLPAEAEVIKNDDLIIIRLVNIDFPANKATLEPQYFNLLAKVQKSIQLFPNCTAVIEGHTDGQGDYRKNIDISEQRAIAVYQYLTATMGTEASRITTAGLGGTKPIANNSTQEGRAKNRRIEIVINPHFASGK
jgi:outer membrane protein OmpA-like peptidoglycan-associated protein